MKLWAGDPSLEALRRKTGVATSTLSDAFNPQRRRLPPLELVRAVVRACGADAAQAARREHAWRSVRSREGIPAAAPAKAAAAAAAALFGPRAQIDRQSQKATISLGMPTTRSGDLE